MKKSKKLLYASLFTVLLAPFAIKLILTFISHNTEVTNVITAGVIFAIALPIFICTYIYFEFIDYRKKQEILKEEK